MISKNTKIINKMGFHMRPANSFVTAMSRYHSDIRLIVDGKSIDGKSIMSIMAAGIKCGTELTIECDGDDEGAMLKAALDMIETGFGE